MKSENSNIIYIFLDIDGVLNNTNYIKQCYRKHGKPMSMNHTPFDPKNLNNLMILVQTLQNYKYTVYIILSSTWRLHIVDYEIVNARLAEYGLMLNGKTPNLSEDRGKEIQQYLKDKVYNNIIILDDDVKDIIPYYPNNVIRTNIEVGYTVKNMLDSVCLVLYKNKKLCTKCTYCGKLFYKYQPLQFTFILNEPYIKCPYCKKKNYLNFD